MFNIQKLEIISYTYAKYPETVKIPTNARALGANLFDLAYYQKPVVFINHKLQSIGRHCFLNFRGIISIPEDLESYYRLLPGIPVNRLSIRKSGNNPKYIDSIQSISKSQLNAKLELSQFQQKNNEKSLKRNDNKKSNNYLYLIARV